MLKIFQFASKTSCQATPKKVSVSTNMVQNCADGRAVFFHIFYMQGMTEPNIYVIVIDVTDVDKDLVASTRATTYPHHCDVVVTTACEMELKISKFFTCLKTNESCQNCTGGGLFFLLQIFYTQGMTRQTYT